MLKHLDIRVFGQVVGVGFRWEAKQQAKKLKLGGFVRNEPDESVYIEAEGESGDMEKFLEWCKKGPLFAKVERTEFAESAIKDYRNFEIQ